RDVAASDADALLVSRAAAKLIWGDVDPIGRRATLPLMSRTEMRQIVGIVGDVKQGPLSETAAPTVYCYRREEPSPSLALALRTTVPPESLALAAAGVVRVVDPDQPVDDIRTMDSVLDETTTSQRFSALVLGVFAAIALTLASIGVYSVLSYIVS